jgi:hypothetical protein
MAKQEKFKSWDSQVEKSLEEEAKEDQKFMRVLESTCRRELAQKRLAESEFIHKEEDPVYSMDMLFKVADIEDEYYTLYPFEPDEADFYRWLDYLPRFLQEEMHNLGLEICKNNRGFKRFYFYQYGHSYYEYIKQRLSPCEYEYWLAFVNRHEDLPPEEWVPGHWDDEVH